MLCFEGSYARMKLSLVSPLAEGLRTLISSITRVFRTSSGVVSAAATPPEKLPQTAASYACKVLFPRALDSLDLSSSYSGNCRDVNGICFFASSYMKRPRGRNTPLS